MCRFVKKFFKAALGLTSAAILLIALQAQAAASETVKPGAFILAQSADAQKEKQAAEAARAKEAEKQKQMQSEEKKMEMQKQAPKTRGLQSAPAATGTKKIGGQIIRDKECPDGE